MNVGYQQGVARTSKKNPDVSVDADEVSAGYGYSLTSTMPLNFLVMDEEPEGEVPSSLRAGEAIGGHVDSASRQAHRRTSERSQHVRDVLSQNLLLTPPDHAPVREQAISEVACPTHCGQHGATPVRTSSGTCKMKRTSGCDANG
eukprot:CAMPEP_0194519674 /NCGR_PEP_ID=MMETSP0253-20130528/53383_1 /TAXON_ID=2966 /ORGANISM="Noctiluca scintillans" /LENGTH=144 /DNA_ID=CAMNT_0039363833 /DNA_START=67 /DNA_END=499 /DNA_ORIENTATION=-